MSYDDFAFIVRFNHMMTFGSLTPRSHDHGTMFALMKGGLHKAAGAGALQVRRSFANAGRSPQRSLTYR
ncbi:hypothetical protein [Paenibacillus sacheonensis]|uniref:Uncharacterized protein n=1 Tax=Paenibacillus sacheonensis TaxID=742054 RepID=A0A7X5C1X1_9BACL|nr:hypothetical protein [Paenibacillus sacheonensis]MBM7566668.1 hypothetical protein [Paenibacillus sacheonensis]NBC70650.1 hypothetical protein [Paenibacillus sacheonensis]